MGDLTNNLDPYSFIDSMACPEVEDVTPQKGVATKTNNGNVTIWLFGIAMENHNY
jgi:hypothetical protein